MADPLAEQIIEALRTRLALIRTVNGFATNAGVTVLHGRLRTDTDDLHLACFAGAAGEKEDRGRNRIDVLLQVEVAACVPVPDSDTGGRVVELVIGDIQKALELPARSLGGIARDLTPLGRQRLAPIEGTRNEFVSLTYVVSYFRLYGSPDQRV